jgi:hypothetical protein
MSALVDYVGAGSRLAPVKGLALGRGWAWQPKIDGAYIRASTDKAGRITNLMLRSGRLLERGDQGADLLGSMTGLPDAVLHGEAEIHTEAGIRAATSRGWVALHLFDVTRVRGRSLHARLHYYQAHAELEPGGRNDWWTIDGNGDAHDQGGRFCRPVPRDLRRVPVVPMVRTRSAAEELWQSYVERDGGEGVVAVRLDAVPGKRGAKRKVKKTDTLDATVLANQGGVARLAWGGQTFTVSARGRWSALMPGAVVEVAADGFYESGATPRFARIVRARADLAAVAQ